MTEKKTYTPEELKAALENEKLDDAALDFVAGGNKGESFQDMVYLSQFCNVGFNPGNWDANVNKLGELYRRAGTKLDAHNGEDHPNGYFDGLGRNVSRQTALYDLACKINSGQIFIEDIRYLC